MASVLVISSKTVFWALGRSWKNKQGTKPTVFTQSKPLWQSKDWNIYFVMVLISKPAGKSLTHMDKKGLQ